MLILSNHLCSRHKMPCVRQVRATRRHRMPPSDVPHETSAQLQWYYFIPAFNCSSLFIVQGYKECRHFFPFCSMFNAVLKTKLALCNFGFRMSGVDQCFSKHCSCRFQGEYWQWFSNLLQIFTYDVASLILLKITMLHIKILLNVPNIRISLKLKI